jgi:hypothetical protein
MIVDPRIFSERDYLAPTVFKKSGVGVSSLWNYYGTVNEAIVKWKYLNNIAGGANITPKGGVSFAPGTEAQTMGINVDFYERKSSGYWSPIAYKTLRELSYAYPPLIFRFYTREGNGPYYAIFDKAIFAISATSIDSVSSEKLQALDDLYRETQLLKYRYNSLAGFLNDLGKRQLNPKEQQIFNEGILRLQSMQAQIGSLKGIEISYNAQGVVGALGFIPFLIIAIVLIIAAATAWTIVTIEDEKEKTKRINDTYALNQWVVTKKQEIAAQVTSGTLTEAQAADINKTLDGATDTANKVANAASKESDSIFTQIKDLVKWGVLGFVALESFKLLKPKNTV